MAAPRRFALIPAGGKSARFGGALPKQYVELAGTPVLRRTIDALHNSVVLEAMFVVLAPDDKLYAERVGQIAGVVPVYCGGRTRAESVMNGLARIGARAEADDWVLVHDAVRPCVDVSMLNRLLHELEDEPVGGLLAVPLADTLKRASLQVVEDTVPRAGLWCAQTPQVFRREWIDDAHAKVRGEATDDSMLVEAAGYRVHLTPGDPLDRKSVV